MQLRYILFTLFLLFIMLYRRKYRIMHVCRYRLLSYSIIYFYYRERRAGGGAHQAQCDNLELHCGFYVKVHEYDQMQVKLPDYGCIELQMVP